MEGVSAQLEEAPFIPMDLIEHEIGPILCFRAQLTLRAVCKWLSRATFVRQVPPRVEGKFRVDHARLFPMLRTLNMIAHDILNKALPSLDNVQDFFHVYAPDPIITSLPSLRKLVIDLPYGSADFSLLSVLTSLEHLSIQGKSSFKDMTLAKLTTLTHLDYRPSVPARKNVGAYFDKSLPCLARLTELCVGCVPRVSTECISGMTNLRVLALDGSMNQSVLTLDCLAPLKHLTQLHITNFPRAEARHLAPLTALQHLSVTFCFMDSTAIGALPRLMQNVRLHAVGGAIHGSDLVRCFPQATLQLTKTHAIWNRVPQQFCRDAPEALTPKQVFPGVWSPKLEPYNKNSLEALMETLREEGTDFVWKAEANEPIV